MWINLDREIVDKLQNKLIEVTGGTQGILNSGNIDSALKSPNASFGGQDLYPTDLHKCCKIYHALVSNHGYVDGNKRIGLCIFLICLNNCNYNYLELDVDFMKDLTLQIAAGKLNVDQTYDIIKKELGI